MRPCSITRSSLQRSQKIIHNLMKERLIFAAATAAAIYVVSYCVLSYQGGYYDVPDSDGSIRLDANGVQIPLTLAFLWQPRFGYLSERKIDLLGHVFRPLIIIDRLLVHKTKYMTDRDFHAWARQLPPSKIHPRFRGKFADEWRKRNSEKHSGG